MNRMNILIAVDKFKGSLTASQACKAIEEGIKNIYTDYLVVKTPLADGGEGTLEVFENAIHFNKVYHNVYDPLFQKMETYYGFDNDTAYIEMASASGLQLLKEDERNPMLTTSFGTGELIKDAITKGAKNISLFIGGSAANDAGIGLASALGYKFLDEQNKVLEPIGKNLTQIKYIDKSDAIDFKDTNLVVLTDVQNVLFGKDGAAYVYAAQKGASKTEIEELDKGLRNFAEVVNNTFNKDISKIPGSGAAGGVGAGVIAFCNAQIVSGTETILDLLEIEKQIMQSDLVITGEGMLDKQTLQGKVVKGIMDRCEKLNKPLAILSGDCSLTSDEINGIYHTILKTIKKKDISLEDSIEKAYEYLVQRSEEMIKELSERTT